MNEEPIKFEIKCRCGNPNCQMKIRYEDTTGKLELFDTDGNWGGINLTVEDLFDLDKLIKYIILKKSQNNLSEEERYELFENEISEMTDFLKDINNFVSENNLSLQNALKFIFKMLINLNTRIYKLDDKMKKLLENKI